METKVVREIKKISLDDNHRFSFIAKYIINNMSLVPNLSIKELARETYSSPSTINRFTKYLNLSGYKELIHVIKYFSYTLLENQSENKQTDDDILHKTYLSVINSIQDTYSLVTLQDEVIIEIVDKLKVSARIFIYAVGGTFNLAKDFQEKLLRIGLNAVVVDNFHNGYFLAKQSNKDIFNIIISYSGETQDLIKLALVCKENNSPVLAISKKTNNTLSKIADLKLQISSDESIFRSVSITSRLALMFSLDMIFYNFLLTDFEHYKLVLKSTALNKL